MDRRALLAGTVALLAAPLGAYMQHVAKLPTIGFLGASTPSGMRGWVAAFLD
jgi:hypothetical protein